MRESFEKKIHPKLKAAVLAHKEAVEGLNSLGQFAAPELVLEIQSRLRRKLNEAAQQWPDDPAEPDPVWDAVHTRSPDGKDESEDREFLEQLHWDRYRRPLYRDMYEAERGNLRAQEHINQTSLDYQRARFGKGQEIRPPKGGFNWDHEAIFYSGLQLGLAELTKRELAEFFDAYCPCGKTHDEDALYKQRYRIQQALKEANSWRNKLQSQDSDSQDEEADDAQQSRSR